MKRVGILRGGKENYDLSIWQGGKLISYLQENLADKYKLVDILVDRRGVWHIAGMPASVGDLLHRVDFIWNVAHQNFSKLLFDLSFPEIGIPINFSHRSPALWRKEAENLGLKIPRSIILPLYQADFDGPKNRYAIKKAKEAHEKFSPPWIVKSLTPSDMASPVAGLRPRGIHVVNTFNELVDAIEDGVSHKESVVVEELIPGESAEAHTISGYRGEDVYVFPTGSKEIEPFAKKLHNHLGARHYLKSEFTVSPRRGIYLTELSFVPDLRDNSNFHNLCVQVGTKPQDVIEHILERAIH